MNKRKHPPGRRLAGWLLLASGWVVAGVIYLAGTRSEKPIVPNGMAGTPPPNAIFGQAVADESLAGASIGFCVLDREGGVVFESPLANTALAPASALKTVTTGAAFGLLGSDFHFETSLTATARIDKAGALAGDLVIVGGGDPTLETAGLERLADQAVEAGLKTLTGRIRADASAFPELPVSDHWNWGDIGNAYGAGAYGLNVNHNRLRVVFNPGSRPGDAASLAGSDTDLPSGRFINRVLTGARGSGDQVMVYSEPYGETLTLRGTVPAGERGFGVTGAIPDPPALATEIVRARLVKRGVKVGGARTSATGREMIATVRSAPLPEIVDHLHRVSDNLESQCFFLTIGRQAGKDPAEVVKAYWESRGVRFQGLRLLDGSGLARANMIRPRDLAAINLAARKSEFGERFFQTLSEYDGGKVRSKLGAMSGVRSEVGFLRGKGGDEFTFCLIANGLGAEADFPKLRADLLNSLQGPR